MAEQETNLIKRKHGIAQVNYTRIVTSVDAYHAFSSTLESLREIYLQISPPYLLTETIETLEAFILLSHIQIRFSRLPQILCRR